MNKKNIFLWALYDFANSIVVIAFFLYFSQWLVIDNNVADIWFNLIFVGSSILLVLTAPVVSAIADRAGDRFSYLRVLTILMFLALMLTSLLSIFFQITPIMIVLVVGFYLLSTYFYQFSLIFYNAFLYDIAPVKIRGMISGLGQSAGWLGQIAGLLITLPLATGAIILIGNPGRVQTFLPATIFFFLLTLPMLLFFKENRKPKKIDLSFVNEYRNVIKSFVTLCRKPGVGRFLLGYFFFNDAMLTVSGNFPIYIEQVFGVSDTTKSFFLIGILITTAFGAFSGGWLGDKVGLKKMLIFVLIGTLIVLPVFALINNFLIFVICVISFGFLYGATWAVTRAVMTVLSPKESVTHAFSYYTMAERFATFVGPVTWGLITYYLIGAGNLRYRVATLTMAIFILIGLLIVVKIPDRGLNMLVEPRKE